VRGWVMGRSSRRLGRVDAQLHFGEQAEVALEPDLVGSSHLQGLRQSFRPCMGNGPEGQECTVNTGMCVKGDSL